MGDGNFYGAVVVCPPPLHRMAVGEERLDRKERGGSGMTNEWILGCVCV